MQFEFATSARVIFGTGRFSRLPELIAAFGNRALLLTGMTSFEASGLLQRTEELLASHDLEFRRVRVHPEPTAELIDDLLGTAYSFAPHAIVAIGGGSVIDAGKAIASLLTNGGSITDYLEGVGEKKVIRPSVPMIAVPTTSGTGSEVTKNAVIRSEDGRYKRSMRSPLMRPAIALVDPELTLAAPRSVTAASGADAQTQLIEAFTSRRASLITDSLARQGIRLAASSLEQACSDAADLHARESMSMASLLGGMCLDNAGLGAVHGLASPLGGVVEIPHGVVCANLMPEITETNLRIAGEDSNAAPTLGKYREVARALSGESSAEPSDLVQLLKDQRKRLAIPSLASFGLTREHVARVVAQCRTGSMACNPVHLDDSVLSEILLKHLEIED